MHSNLNNNKLISAESVFNFALRAQTDLRAAPKVAGAKAALIPESVGFVWPCSWSSAKRLPPATTVWRLFPACASAPGSGRGGLNEGLQGWMVIG